MKHDKSTLGLYLRSNFPAFLEKAFKTLNPTTEFPASCEIWLNPNGLICLMLLQSMLIPPMARKPANFR